MPTLGIVRLSEATKDREIFPPPSVEPALPACWHGWLGREGTAGDNSSRDDDSSVGNPEMLHRTAARMMALSCDCTPRRIRPRVGEATGSLDGACRPTGPVRLGTMHSKRDRMTATNRKARLRPLRILLAAVAGLALAAGSWWSPLDQVLVWHWRIRLATADDSRAARIVERISAHGEVGLEALAALLGSARSSVVDAARRLDPPRDRPLAAARSHDCASACAASGPGAGRPSGAIQPGRTAYRIGFRRADFARGEPSSRTAAPATGGGLRTSAPYEHS